MKLGGQFVEKSVLNIYPVITFWFFLFVWCLWSSEVS